MICASGAVLLAVLANLYVFLMRPFGATNGISIEETGPIGTLIATIVPYVWLFLFAGIGSSFWLLARAQGRMSSPSWLLLALLLLCVGYPIYTGNLNQPLVALAANVAVVGVAALAVWTIWPISRVGACLLIPVIGWVALASVTLIALVAGFEF